jgi:tight adherence protein B
VWTEMLRDTLSAAAGLEQALLASATIAPEAIREDIQALARRIQHGDALADALQHLPSDLDDPTGDLVLSALLMAAGHPARQLADLLGELAVQAREQVSMRLRIEAGRARTRTTVRLIVGTTLALVVGMVVFNRAYLAPYDSLLGQGVLLIVGGLFAVSFWWLDRMARLHDTPERVLTNLSAMHREDQP